MYGVVFVCTCRDLLLQASITRLGPMGGARWRQRPGPWRWNGWMLMLAFARLGDSADAMEAGQEASTNKRAFVAVQINTCSHLYPPTEYWYMC